MTSREEVNHHSEKLWFVCLDQTYLEKKLSPLVETLDWYNNHLLTRCLIDKKLSLDFGERLLMGTSGLLLAQRLMIVGLGQKKQLTAAKARSLLQDLGQVLGELKEESSWIIVGKDAPNAFVEELKKSRTSVETLNQATISIG